MASVRPGTATSKEVTVEKVENVQTDRKLEAAFPSSEVAAEALGGDLEDMPPGYYRSSKFIGTMIGVSLMNISLYVGYVLPVGPDPNYTLIPITKTLGGGVCVLLVGRLGDIFGRRWFLIGGQTLGMIGAIIAATAKDINTIMGATAFIGIAGAVQLTFFIVVQELVPNKYRGLAMASQFIMSFPFAAFGPVMARGLVLHTALSWRWNYWLNLITCGSSIILFFFFYHPPSYGLLHQGKSLRRKLKKLDYIGLVLYCGGLIMLLLGISWGGTVHPWNSGPVIGCLVGGIVGLGVFALYDIYVPMRYPLMPFHVIKSRDFVALCITGSVATMIYNSMNVLWPRMINSLLTTDIMEVGWYSTTLGGSVALGQISAGFTLRPFGKPMKAHWQMRIAAMGMAAFVAGLASITPNRHALAAVLTALAGFSVGYVELLALIMVPFTCDPGDIGFASGFQSSCRGSSGSIATAIYATILGNQNKINIPKYVGPAAIKAGLSPSAVKAAVAAAQANTAKAYAAVPGMNPSIKAAMASALQVANTKSFKMLFLVSLAFGLTSVLASFFIRSIDQFLTNEVARKLQGVEKKSQKEVEV